MSPHSVVRISRTLTGMRLMRGSVRVQSGNLTRARCERGRILRTTPIDGWRFNLTSWPVRRHVDARMMWGSCLFMVLFWGRVRVTLYPLKGIKTPCRGWWKDVVL